MCDGRHTWVAFAAEMVRRIVRLEERCRNVTAARNNAHMETDRWRGLVR